MKHANKHLQAIYKSFIGCFFYFILYAPNECFGWIAAETEIKKQTENILNIYKSRYKAKQRKK